MSLLARVSATLLLWFGFAASAPAQVSKDATDQIDALVAKAYQAASAKLPCKISASAGSHMMDWKKVGKCMEEAILRVDWEEFSRQLMDLRHPSVSEGDFASAVEQSLTRQALTYNKLFRVSNKEALLPLTNAVLKYAIQDSLVDRPVFPLRAKYEIGVFSGIFYFERAGAVATGGSYRLAMFQYTDPQGKMQTPSDKLLLDSFGIRWSEIEAKPGFRFPVDMLPGIGRR